MTDQAALVAKLEEAEAHRRDLIQEYQQYELQLGARDTRGYPHGPDYLRWRRATVQALSLKKAEIAAVKNEIRELRRQIRDVKAVPRPPQEGELPRWVRIERKLDLLLAVMGVSIPGELQPLPPAAEPSPVDIKRDQHGTPWDDPIVRRVPGSFESNSR